MKGVKLAINGGSPVRTKPWMIQYCLNEDDRKAVNDVLTRNVLSGYKANKEGHQGGPEIKALIAEWCEKFEVKYAIPCNSGTSGLMACMMAGVRGKMAVRTAEVTPYSMTCSASLPILFGLEPEFGDVDKTYFQLIPEVIKPMSLSIPVSLFGHPLVKQYHGDLIIEDSCQCVSMQDIETDYRVHSFTTGKHISTGEGGMITTNNKALAEAAAYHINHFESVAHSMQMKKAGVGLNLRMNEMTAALVRTQLRRLDENVRIRRENIEYLNKHLDGIGGIRHAKAAKPGVHSYYCAPFHYESSKVSRDRFIAAVRSELQNVRVNTGYIEPLYRFPCFDQKFHAVHKPNVEELWRKKLFLLLDIAYPHTLDDMRDVVTAFYKVAENAKDIPKANRI